MGYGAKDTSINEFLEPSSTPVLEGDGGSFGACALEPSTPIRGMLGMTDSLDSSLELGSCEAITSFSFFLYFSLSLSALSRSLFKPNIIALCLSTNRHSCEFCWDCECFSFSKY